MARKLHIPRLGDELEVALDWVFDIHAEGRNKSLMEVVEGREIERWHEFRIKWNSQIEQWEPDGFDDYPKKFRILAGTKLKVERIYIRKGAEDFDSLTFRVLESPDPRIVKARFWAMLDDVNRMVIA